MTDNAQGAVQAGQPAVTDADLKMSILERKVSGLEVLLAERGAENETLRNRILQQQTLLYKALGVVTESDIYAGLAFISEIEALLPVMAPDPSPVEWYDVVDLPAYEPGARYVILVGDVQHLCMESEKQHTDEKRWFHSTLDGTMHPGDSIEAWRADKDYLPPAGWVSCSPAWLKQGGMCGEAQRWFDGKIGNHYHPPVKQSPPLPASSDTSSQCLQ